MKRKTGACNGATLKRLFLSFCGTTPMHGFAYLASQRNYVELVFWIGIVLCSLGLGFYLMSLISSDWINSPVSNEIIEHQYSVRRIEFPVVTICAKQSVDELQYLSNIMNRLDFSCDPTDDPENVCSEKPIRKDLKLFLTAIPEWVNNAVDFMEGEINMVQRVEKEFSLEEMPFFKGNKKFTAVLFNFIHIYSKKSKKYSEWMTSVSIDEALFTNNYLDHVLFHFWRLNQEQGVPFYAMPARQHRNGKEQNNSIAILEKLIDTVGASNEIMAGDHFDNHPDNIDCTNVLCDYYSQILRLCKKEYFSHRLNSMGLGGLYRNMLHYVLYDIRTEYGVESNLTTHMRNELKNVQRNILDGPFLHDIAVFFEEHTLKLKSEYYNEYNETNVKDLPIANIMHIMKNSLVYANMMPFLLTQVNDTEYKFIKTNDTDWWTYSSLRQTQPSPYFHFLDKVFSNHESYVIPYLMFEKESKNSIYGGTSKIMNASISSDKKDSPRLELIRFCSNNNNNNQSGSCKEHFFHVPTTQGLCAAYNTMPLKTLLKNSTYIKHFSESFTTNQNEQPQLIWQNAQINLLLDIRNMEISKTANGEIYVGIQYKYDFMDMRESILALPGYKTVVYIIPQAQDADSAIKGITSRKCMFHSDPNIEEVIQKSQLFTHYSRSSCKLECHLKAVSFKFGCSPWDIPPLKESMGRVCNGTEAKLFKFQLAQNEFSNKTINATLHDCIYLCKWDNCEANLYEFHEESSTLNPSIECNKRHIYDSLQDFEMLNVFAMELSAHEYYLQGSIIGMKLCRKKIEFDISALDILIAKDLIIQTENQVSAHWFDKIGMLGGCIGLFNGFSLLVTVELLFWLAFKIPEANLKDSDTAMGKNKDEKTISLRRYLSSIIFRYLSASSLHGMVYISDEAKLGSRIFWAFIVFTSTCIVTYLIISGFQDVTSEPFLTDSNITGMSVNDLQYPTLTICPKQHNDRWNLARILLDTVKLNCNGSECSQGTKKLHETFDIFLKQLVYHDWIQADQMKFSTDLDKTKIVQDILFMAKTENGQEFFQQKVLHQLLGLPAKDLPSKTGKFALNSFRKDWTIIDTNGLIDTEKDDFKSVLLSYQPHTEVFIHMVGSTNTKSFLIELPDYVILQAFHVTIGKDNSLEHTSITAWSDKDQYYKDNKKDNKFSAWKPHLKQYDVPFKPDEEVKPYNWFTRAIKRAVNCDPVLQPPPNYLSSPFKKIRMLCKRVIEGKIIQLNIYEPTQSFKLFHFQLEESTVKDGCNKESKLVPGLGFNCIHHTPTKNYLPASRDICKRLGGELMSIHCQDEYEAFNDYLYTFTDKAENRIIGLYLSIFNYANQTEGFAWTDGSPTDWIPDIIKGDKIEWKVFEITGITSAVQLSKIC